MPAFSSPPSARAGFFLVNAASFAAVLGALCLLRRGELQARERASLRRGSLIEGFRYVWRRPDLKAVLLMLFLIATFGLNFPIFISTMAVTVFHAGADSPANVESSRPTR